MGQSRILAINELAESQVQAFQTVNDAVDALEKAGNRVSHFDVNGLDTYVMSEADFVRSQIFVLENLTEDVALVLPQSINTVATNRLFHVVNAGTYNVTAHGDASGGDEVIIEGGTSTSLYMEGNDVNSLGSIGSGGGSGSAAFSMGMFIQNKPNDGELLVQYSFASTITFSVNFAGSQGYANTNPTSNATFTVKKNDTQIGTFAYGTTGSVTFTLASSTIFNPGDYMTIEAPSPQDATLANVSFTLKGLR